MTRIRDIANILSSSTNMATDAEVSAVSAQIPVNVAGKNFVINGDMNISQRGTSNTLVSTQGYYACDRWQLSPASQGTWTISQESDAPAGFAKSFKLLCTTADSNPDSTDRLRIAQRVEGQNLQSLAYGSSGAKTVTVSFWVKSNKTGTYIFELFNDNVTRQFSKSYNVDSSNAWEYKNITFIGDTNGTFQNNENQALSLIWWFGAGTSWTSGTLNTSWSANINANRAVGCSNLASDVNNYVQITGVQLEIGSVATAFSRAGGDIQGELAKCQRYYFRTQTGTGTPYMGVTVAGSSTTTYVNIIHKVTMRSTPTSVDFSAIRWQAINNSGNITSASISDATPENTLLVCATTGATTAQMNYVIGQTTSGYIGLNAEL
jgi:hypothetical protein